MNEKSVHRRSSLNKIKKKRFIKMLEHEGYTGSASMSERLGVTTSAIQKWKRDYCADKKK